MIVVVVTGAAARDLDGVTTAVAPFVHDAWELRTEPMPWGTLVTAGAPELAGERWSVLGRPVSDPWGRPSATGAPQLLRLLERLGGASGAALGRGSFVALDRTTGELHAPPSGLVSLWESTDATVRGTPHDAVAGVAASAPRRIDAPAAIVWEKVAGVDAAAVERELASVVCDAPSMPSDDDVVWSPRLTVREPGVHLAEHVDGLRVMLAALAWHERGADRWLHAPLFERPGIDLLSLAGASR